MKWAAIAVAAALALGGLLFAVTSPQTRLTAPDSAALALPGDATKGGLVFSAAGCESCHVSPAQPDPLRLGGGFELKTPFGSFYPPNISPDNADGIGAWTAENFANALWSGVSPSGEHYYPAFPYASYQRMSLEDVRNLLAFLRNLPPVGGRAPAHKLPFPFTIRRAIGVWKALYFANAPLTTLPDLDATMARGRYLVEGPGHCAECHSPRNFLGAIDASRRLKGGPSPDGKGKSADITATGLKDWTQSDIAEALSSGFTPSGDVLGGAMAAVIRNLARLPQSDRDAIAHYLKSGRYDASP